MKILVERELFKDLLHELDYNQECGVRNVKLVVKRILEENPVAAKEQNRQAIIEILDMLIYQEILRVANSQIPDIKSLVWIKAEELKSKLVGEK